MKIFATLAVLVVATIGSASATLITYNTTGSGFTPGFTPSITVPGSGATATLAYTPILPGSVFNDASPGTNISYGEFRLTVSGSQTTVISFPAFIFLLFVNETGPSPSTQTIVASSGGGTVSGTSSNLNVFYVPTVFSLPSSASTPRTDFTVINPTQIVAPTTNSGTSSIQGFAIGANTPEPGTMLLLGAGLVAVGFTVRKKSAKIG